MQIQLNISAEIENGFSWMLPNLSYKSVWEGNSDKFTTNKAGPWKITAHEPCWQSWYNSIGLSSFKWDSSAGFSTVNWYTRTYQCKCEIEKMQIKLSFNPTAHIHAVLKTRAPYALLQRDLLSSCSSSKIRAL